MHALHRYMIRSSTARFAFVMQIPSLISEHTHSLWDKYKRTKITTQNEQKLMHIDGMETFRCPFGCSVLNRWILLVWFWLRSSDNSHFNGPVKQTLWMNTKTHIRQDYQSLFCRSFANICCFYFFFKFLSTSHIRT